MNLRLLEFLTDLYLWWPFEWGHEWLRRKVGICLHDDLRLALEKILLKQTEENQEWLSEGIGHLAAAAHDLEYIPDETPLEE